MGGAQIGSGKDAKDRSIRPLAGEVNVSHDPADEPRGIQAGAALQHRTESESCNRLADAALGCLLHGAGKVAPEGFAGSVCGSVGSVPSWLLKVSTRRNTAACSARIRSAIPSRATSREVEASASIGRPPGVAMPASLRARPMSGMKGPLEDWICSARVSAALASEAGPGSASTMAESCPEMKADGASTQRLSTMGKAPAAPKACTRSGAGLSATTTIGPWRDMSPRGWIAKARKSSHTPLMSRQRNLDKAGYAPKASVTSGLTPILTRALRKASPSSAAPARRWPDRASGRAAMRPPLSISVIRRCSSRKAKR